MRTLALPRPKTVTFNGRGLVLLALLSVYIIWGSTYLAIRVALEEIPPFLLVGLRFTIAGGLMYGFLRWRGVPNPTWRQWRSALIIGMLLLGGGNGGVTFSEQWVSSSVAAIAVATVPLWAALFASIWERYPTPGEWIGIGLGLVGIMILNFGGDLWVNSIGAVVLMAAPLSWSFGSVYSRQLTLPQGAMSSAAQMLAVGPAFLIFGLLRGEQITHVPSSEVLFTLAYLVVAGSIIGFNAYVYLIKNVPPVLATSYAYVNPVIAVFLGWLIISEKLGLQTLIGAAVILTAVIVINTERYRGK